MKVKANARSKMCCDPGSRPSPGWLSAGNRDDQSDKIWPTRLPRCDDIEASDITHIKRNQVPTLSNIGALPDYHRLASALILWDRIDCWSENHLRNSSDLISKLKGVYCIGNKETTTGTESVRGSNTMNSKHLRILGIILTVVALGSILLAACVRPGTPEANSGGSTPTAGGGGSSCASGTAHMSSNNFVQNCVNVTKGSKLTLIDDVQVLHILGNGMWNSSGNAVPAKEPGAPTVSNLQVSGGTVTIGPFTTAGTFHIYCSVHVGMNLIVNVK